MYQLANKHVVLGITGGIAAYKSADLARRLRDAGASVRVVMTPAAREFITPLTLQAVSGNPVSTELLDPAAEAAMGHIELARWADLVLVAPASADFLARMASGQANDLLATLVLATDAVVAVAPAMNQAMWRDSATQANVAILRQRGIHVLGPGEGEQACGDTGPGRMLEPVTIRDLAAELFVSRILDGKRVLVTAGPTREAMDPVRFISNHSSGRMGFALASAAVEAGALVTLVSGPVCLATPDRVSRLDVTSAADMLAACQQHAASSDILIATAAVADYRPARVADHKIKKSEEAMTIELVRNPDIVASVAQMRPRPFIVGFAAETRDVVAYAREKLERKGLDMIIANDVSDPAIGFNSEDNEVIAIWREGTRAFDRMPKDKLARKLVELIGSRQPMPA